MKKKPLPFEQYINGEWVFKEHSRLLEKGYKIRLPKSYPQQKLDKLSNVCYT